MRSQVTRWASALALVLLVSLFGPGLCGPQGAGGQEAPRPIGLQDILDWERIGGATLSNDGAWFA